MLLHNGLQLLVDTLGHGAVSTHIEVALLQHHLTVYLLPHLHQQVLDVGLKAEKGMDVGKKVIM